MIRVFVGCSPGQDTESQAVLEYSLRAHASEPVEITWMALNGDRKSPWGGWDCTGWQTPFTSLRWAIPEVCGNEGRAIYLDSDVIVMGDIAELWDQPMPEGAFALIKGEGRKLRTCVMVLDCAEAKNHLPPVKAMKRMRNIHVAICAQLAAEPHLTGQIEGLWNCVDLKGSSLDDPALKLIHYSSIAHQPSTRHAVERLTREGRRHWYDGWRFDHWRPELIELFDQLLTEAPIAGYALERYEPAIRFEPQGLKSYRGVRVKGYSA
jgi:hypothetical protein